jgi:hypothetical protein
MHRPQRQASTHHSMMFNQSPTDSFQPQSPTDSFQPQSPTDSFQPQSPTDRFQPQSPTDSFQPQSPTDSFQPQSPTDSFQPQSPTDSFQPQSPTDSITATQTINRRRQHTLIHTPACAPTQTHKHQHHVQTVHCQRPTGQQRQYDSARQAQAAPTPARSSVTTEQSAPHAQVAPTTGAGSSVRPTSAGRSACQH